jgi:peroxiredoxin
MANELQLKLKEGDIPPSFTSATNGDARISLSDYKGKNVILSWAYRTFRLPELGGK